MVLELTDELIAYDDSDERLVVECISNLLLGYYESNHFLLASELFCSYFSGLISEGRVSRALNHLRNNNGVYPDVMWTKKVRLDKNVTKGDDDLPISFFQKTVSIQPSVLLCENFLDVKFYTRLCEEYHSAYGLALNGMMGGGQTTKDVFRKLRRSNQISLTIVDSDIKYPGAPKGATASGVESINANRLAHVGLYVLNVHEVENLIPFDCLYEHSYKGKAKVFMRKLKAKGLYKYIQYYDVKHGFRTKDVKDSAGLKSYAEQLYNDIFPKSKGKFSKFLKECQTKDDESGREGKAGVFPALRCDMLDKFLECSNQISQSDIFEPERKHIADLVYTYACARSKDVIM